MLASASATSTTTVLASIDLQIGIESPPLKTQLHLSKIFLEHSSIVHHQVGVGINGKLISCNENDQESWMKHVQWAKDCQSQNLQLIIKENCLVFCTSRNIRRNEELFTWFAPKLIEELGIPFLSPSNIQGHQCYVCHICNQIFTNPNPLKIHLAFQCIPQPSLLSRNNIFENIIIPLPEIRPSIPYRPHPIHPIRPIITPHSSHINWHCVSTSESHNRQLHYSIYSTSRRGHQCIYCGKVYSRKYGLKIHIRTHTGYKPLKCRICLRPFGDPSNLNKHVRLHAQGNTPYRCDLCGKVLVRRRDLERHVKSRHPNNNDSHTTTKITVKNQESQVVATKEEKI